MPVLPATAAAIAEAAHIVRDGGLVAFPTETVYGLGADAGNARAVAGIFAAKGRPAFNPLIVHVASLAAAEEFAVVDAPARELAMRFWPGPLTIVLRKRGDCRIADLATAGLDTVGVRVPAQPVALALLAGAGVPLAAPSANRSGRVSPTTAEHVAAEFGAGLLILDGGATPVGLESTIVDASRGELRLLRPGSVTFAMLEQVVRPIQRGTGDAARPSAPGQLASHYAPRAKVVLGVGHIVPGMAILAFGPGPLPDGVPVINLSASGDLAEAAANLFAALRTLDASGVAIIAAMPVPDTGLGEAINDRLRRAAAAR